MRKISGFMFWALFGLAVVIIPIACGSSSSSDGGNTDSAPVDMTKN